ncbi:MAG: toll/interleukin-1 receptor domain-containing protein, partial [Vitreimonas sp.]
MAELYRYAAFLSYSSRDERFARRLHRALESYAIPSTLGRFDLVGGGGKLNRIYPVFRDREELSAGDLGERIEAALRASGALIVVCSPRAAASPWVQKEVEFFLSLGRRERIFAIIADDAPSQAEDGADATPLCFPPALRGDALRDRASLEPLAADARPSKDGFRNAWLKVVAGLIGVTPGQLIDRDRKRRRRQVVALGAGLAVTAFIVSVSVAWTSAQTWRTRLSTYAERLASEGRPADALPFALAGVPPPGALTPARSDRADPSLVRTGAMRGSRDLGRLRTLALSANGASLVVQRENGDGAYFDLARGGAPRNLDPLGDILESEGPLLSANGAALVIQTRTFSGAYYDLARGGRRYPLVGHRQANHRLSANGAVLVAHFMWEGTAAYYDLAHEGERRDLGPIGDADYGRGLHLSDDGSAFVVRNRDGSSTYFDLAGGGAAIDLGRLRDVTLSANGKALIALDADGRVIWYDLARGGIARDLGLALTSQDLASNASLSADGSFFVVRTQDGGRVSFDLSRDGARRDLPEGSNYSLARNGAALVVLDYRTVTWYDLANGGEPRRLTGLDLGFSAKTLLSDDGSSLVVFEDRDRSVHVDLAQGGARRPLENLIGVSLLELAVGTHIGNFGTVLSNDGAVLLTRADDGAAAYYDLNGDGRRRSLGNISLPSTTGNWRLSMNGAALFTRSGEGTFTLYDLAHGGERSDLGRLDRYALSDDGEHLAVLAQGGAGALYNLADRPWNGQSAPTGAALHGAVCAASS